MSDWGDFPSRTIKPREAVYRIHQFDNDPAWFNNDGSWRFDPPLGHRDRFGVCYLGREDIASYVEVFGRIRAVPGTEISSRRLSQMTVSRPIEVADLTARRVLGDFGITASHSTGTDYGPSQELAAELFDAGFDGIVYRVRHDPAMTLEGVALFGEPGEHPERFNPPKTDLIPDSLTERGRRFGIEVLPPAPLP